MKILISVSRAFTFLAAAFILIPSAQAAKGRNVRVSVQTSSTQEVLDVKVVMTPNLNAIEHLLLAKIEMIRNLANPNGQGPRQVTEHGSVDQNGVMSTTNQSMIKALNSDLAKIAAFRRFSPGFDGLPAHQLPRISGYGFDLVQVQTLTGARTVSQLNISTQTRLNDLLTPIERAALDNVMNKVELQAVVRDTRNGRFSLFTSDLKVDRSSSEGVTYNDLMPFDPIQLKNAQGESLGGMMSRSQTRDLQPWEITKHVVTASQLNNPARAMTCEALFGL